MSAQINLVLKEIGSRLNNIGKIVDTDPNNDDEITSNIDKTSNDTGALANIIKSLKNMDGASAAASDTAATTAAANTASVAGTASAASDKNIKDITNKDDKTEDIIERAYLGLDSIIYKYNQKGQALGEDDQLRAGITAQSLQNSILESNVFKDPETGFLKINTSQQTLANAAAIKILFEKIEKLEALIKK